MNHAFTFATDERGEAFARGIVDRMMERFGITRDEAVGRLNREWRDVPLIGDDIVYHETTDYWAHTVYYGKDSEWWLDPPDLVPQPYP